MFGFMKTSLWDRVDADAREAFGELMASLGDRVEEIELAVPTAEVLDLQRAIGGAEIASHQPPMPATSSAIGAPIVFTSYGIGKPRIIAPGAAAAFAHLRHALVVRAQLLEPAVFVSAAGHAQVLRGVAQKAISAITGKVAASLIGALVLSANRAARTILTGDAVDAQTVSLLAHLVVAAVARVVTLRRRFTQPS